MTPHSINENPTPDIDSALDPIVSADDVRQRWRALMGPLGFGERLLRMVLVDPDRCFTKAIIELEIPHQPSPTYLKNIMGALRTLVGESPGATVAFLLTRPGADGISDTDRRWSRAVINCAHDHGVPIEPFYRANDETLLLVEPAA